MNFEKLKILTMNYCYQIVPLDFAQLIRLKYMSTLNIFGLAMVTEIDLLESVCEEFEVNECYFDLIARPLICGWINYNTIWNTYISN